MATFVRVFFQFFFLLTPFFVLTVFLAWTEAFDEVRRKRLALRVMLAVMVLSVCLMLFGNLAFYLLGITVDAFRVGAGALLFLSAVGLVRGTAFEAPPDSTADIAVVPLAIPVTLGPATVGTILVLSGERAKAIESHTLVWTDFACEWLGIMLAIAAVGAMLYLSAYLQRLIGRRGLSILSKLTGLVLAAMSAQMFFAGARNLLQLAPAAS